MERLKTTRLVRSLVGLLAFLQAGAPLAADCFTTKHVPERDMPFPEYNNSSVCTLVLAAINTAFQSCKPALEVSCEIPASTVVGIDVPAWREIPLYTKQGKESAGAFELVRTLVESRVKSQGPVTGTVITEVQERQVARVLSAVRSAQQTPYPLLLSRAYVEVGERAERSTEVAYQLAQPDCHRASVEGYKSFAARLYLQRDVDIPVENRRLESGGFAVIRPSDVMSAGEATLLRIESKHYVIHGTGLNYANVYELQLRARESGVRSGRGALGSMQVCSLVPTKAAK